ncbi:hypothetical protein Ocin01_08935 [Orchesella cincta]|uniref:HCLS1-associated protein X-1 n=1 Tax=Orchesella cincta TaxID=48709 RepID=A0A1D2MYL5_ORCCI|nr:hypothetical protein Ocin01_08935 [Orchesella cincta]
MEWRDFIRGFFGRSHQDPPRGGSNNFNNQWPPPPPIPDFNDESSQDEPTDGARSEDHRGFSSGARGGGEFGDIDREFEEFGNSFVFGHVFSAMGEMFKEMERSMRDLDGFFENMRIEDHNSAIPFSGPPAIQDVPLDGVKAYERRDKDVSIRDSVLKEPETPQNRESRHYVSKPRSGQDNKLDRDLDELYLNSQLDLSDLPVPDCGKSKEGDLCPVPVEPPSQGKFSSSFQRTYQTFSFKNGRWEGEIVKEDPSGKHVTRYYQDESGQRHENTEFYPRDGSSQRSLTGSEQPSTFDSTMVPHESTRLFQLFDRFFRPRM